MAKKRQLPDAIRQRLEEVKAAPVPHPLTGARKLHAQQCALGKLTLAQRSFVSLALRREIAKPEDQTP